MGFWHEEAKSVAQFAETLDSEERKEIGVLLLKTPGYEQIIEKWSKSLNEKFTPQISVMIL